MKAISETARQVGTLLVIGLVLVAGGACGQSPLAKKQKAVARGEQYLKDGKINEAIIEFRTALQVDQDFLPAVHALGRAYIGKSWYGDAARELQRAQKLAPDSVPIAADYGRVLVQAGAWKEAEAQAALILAKDPQNRDGLYIRAASLLGQGKPREVLELFEKVPAGASGPDLSRVIASALFSLGKVSEAEETFRASLAQNPKDVRSLAGLAAIRLSQNQADEALKIYEQAKALQPGDTTIRVGLAATQARLGRLPEAIKTLEEIDPPARSADSMMALGSYYIQDKRAADAARLLAPIVERAPRFTNARYVLASAYLASNDPSAAVIHYEELDRQIPGNVLVGARLASAYTRVGRPRDALSKLDTVAKTLDKSPGYHVERGQALLLLGRLDEAFTEASTAQRLAPQAPQPYLLLGQIQTQRRDARAAREMFAKAAALDATYVPARLALGRLDIVEKNPQEAIKEFDAAVQANPKSLEALQGKIGALLAEKKIKEAIQVAEAAVKANEQDAGLPHAPGQPLCGRQSV